jgi:hypothetical protein
MQRAFLLRQKISWLNRWILSVYKIWKEAYIYEKDFYV